MRYPVPLVLLVVAAFLAPIMGGQVALDNLPILDSSDIFKSLFGSPEAPVIAHAVLALFPCTALIALLIRRKVIQVPNTIVSGLLLVFFAVILGTISYSAFRYISFQATVEWLSYGVAFYAVVAGVGRQKGPYAMVAALAAGSTIVALLGLMEYGQNKASDPTWRIFSIWVNPNALAAMLLIGFCCAGGLVLSRKGTEVAAWFAGALACAIAILLTQSKGGLAALGIASIVLFVLGVAWAGGERKISVVRIAGLIGAVVLMAFLIQLQSKSGGALARVTNAGATADQSAGFRANLWKGAVEMAKERPIGYGIGTYRFESARPGITPQTHFTHQTYLQLMAEASPVALFLFLAVAVMWLYQVFRGARHMPTEQNLLRAGVIAAVFAVGAHSMVDSDLYYYGVGISTFMLLGVGMLLSVDAVAPENVPVMIRRVAAGGVALVAAMFLYFGTTDVLKGQGRGAFALGNAAELASIGGTLNGIAPGDAEGWSMTATAAVSDKTKKMEALEKAVDFGPSLRNYRALAREQVEVGQQQKAISTLRTALQRDPSNFLALLQLAGIQQAMGDQDATKETLKRLIAVEETPYFQIRALPEVIPTETSEARLALAAMEKDDKVKIGLIKTAIDGYARYRETTYPRVRDLVKAVPNGNYAGESMPDAQRKMTTAAQAARDLAKLYRGAGDEPDALKAEEEAGKFEAALSNSK